MTTAIPLGPEPITTPNPAHETMEEMLMREAEGGNPLAASMLETLRKEWKSAEASRAQLG